MFRTCDMRALRDPHLRDDAIFVFARSAVEAFVAFDGRVNFRGCRLADGAAEDDFLKANVAIGGFNGRRSH